MNKKIMNRTKKIVEFIKKYYIIRFTDVNTLGGNFNLSRMQKNLRNKKRLMKKQGMVLSVIVVCIISGIIYMSLQDGVISQQQEQVQNIEVSTQVKEYESSSKVSEYIPGENPLYIDEIIVVNKDYELPNDHLPGESKEAREAFEKMKKDANLEGISLYSCSTYRSYTYQIGLFEKYTQRDGETLANTYSAKPGFSEHQTGLAFDIGGADKSAWANSKFDNTKEAKWLYKNAYKYGFILRYPEGKTHITGYVAESWHYRYVGTEHSYNFAENNMTLEEYLGIYPEKNN